MSSLLTFNTPTFLWSRTTRGIISWPHGRTAAASGPFAVEALTVPFDPIHATGGSFWELKEGTNSGWLVSAWSNSLGYGNITVTSEPGDYVPPANPSYPTIDPLADWRILIKGMGGPTGGPAKNTVTFNAATQIWSRTTAGIISYDYDLAHNPAPSSGTYAVSPVTVPYDPIHKTGGSFWRLLEGPNKGWLVSDWTNSLAYGDITVAQTADYDRGPGETLATIYRPAAHLAGASLNYNAPGEIHFTLLVDDPNINVPQPKRTHYAVEFYDKVSATWVEVFAGMIWDMDATDTEVVLYGVDYLGLFQYVVDERFDPTKAELQPPTGSKYVGKTIQYIISEQLDYAIAQPNSIVGFITRGTIASDLNDTTISGIFSTFRNTLDFTVGLIDSWRAGSGKQTRIQVVKISGVYTVTVTADPGSAKDNLALRYGDLVQGYRVIPFGVNWASRVNFISRDRKGLKVSYKSESGAALEAEWGHIAQGAVFVETEDANDLRRRALQAATDAAAFGRQIAVGLKLGSFRPLEGYDLCDWVPVDIDHGAVHTMQWGSDQFGAELEDGSGTPISSGYWTVVGLTWETYDDGHWMTGLSLFPKNAVPRPYGCEGSTPSGHYPPNNGQQYIGLGLVQYFAPGVAWDIRHPNPGQVGGWNFATYGSVGGPDYAGSQVGNNLRCQVVGSGTITVHVLYDERYADASKHMVARLQHFDGLVDVTDGIILHDAPYDFVFTVPDDGFCNHWVNVTENGVAAHFGFSGFEWVANSLSAPVEIIPPGSTSGTGPPDPHDTANTNYLDIATGIQYVRDPSTWDWVAVPGTGYVASGLYDFTFASATSWVVTHTLGGYPRVTLRDSTGAVIEASIVYNSTTQITVSFSSAVAGSVHLG